MTIATRTLSVNAAFLQEIKQDNVELRNLLESLTTQCRDASSQMSDPRNLCDGLSRLRDQLAMHFALEEAFGYFEDAVDVAPRLSCRADELRAEHDGFFREMCSLVEHAERLLYREESPRRATQTITLRFSAFYEALQAHEACERDLIMEAFDRDIGVGD